MATVLHQNTFTQTGRGQRLASWEGELTPGDLISFVNVDSLPGYSFHLRVSENAFSQETVMAAVLDGHQVTLEIQQLNMLQPVDRYFCASRYLVRYCSALTLDSILEFTVSLVIDGKSWLDYNLGLKRAGFEGWLDYDGGRVPSDGFGPTMGPGPWGKLEWWVRERPLQTPFASPLQSSR